MLTYTSVAFIVLKECPNSSIWSAQFLDLNYGDVGEFLDLKWFTGQASERSVNDTTKSLHICGLQSTCEFLFDKNACILFDWRF